MRKIMKLIRISVLCLSLVLLAVSTLSGLLMNYLLVFLVATAGVMLITLLVAILKKEVHWNHLGEESVSSFIMRGILRNATWIVLGFCVHIALVPIQFSSREFVGLLFFIWGSVVALCIIDWIPRKRISRSLSVVLLVYLIFLSFQLTIIYLPSQNADSVEMSLPFDGDWYVIQGGNSALINHHNFAGSQKYAIDFIDPTDAALPLKEVSDLNQYKTFGRPLYSPVTGVVVSVENSLPDQKIGETDQGNAAGNYIVIKTESDVFVLMAHLLENSVMVAVGAKVTTGQEVAKVGNSGNSTQPHLHIQAMTKPSLWDPDSEPISLYFKDNIDKTSLKRNDRVSGSQG